MGFGPFGVSGPEKFFSNKISFWAAASFTGQLFGQIAKMRVVGSTGSDEMILFLIMTPLLKKKM